MSSNHFNVSAFRWRNSVEAQPFLPSNNASVKRVIKQIFPVELCIKSKAVSLILLWTVIVGILSFAVIN